MQQVNGGMPFRTIPKIIDFGGDAAAGIVTVGYLSEVIPTALAALAALWFVLRFVNFIRVNVFNKDPWSMR